MTDWDSVTFMVCATVLVIVFSGDPDLMDAIIKYLKK